MLILLFSIIYQTTFPQEIIFNSETRGSRETISIRKNTIHIDDNGNQQSYDLAQSDWEKVMKSIQQLEYKKMQHYLAPTEARTYDAARHSTISIKVEDQTYSSTTFDDTKAPKELTKLMTCIVQLKKKYGKK